MHFTSDQKQSTPMEGNMKIIILTATMLIVLGAPTMASEDQNSRSGHVLSANNAPAKGKVHFNEFHITKKIDKASPVLFL